MGQPVVSEQPSTAEVDAELVWRRRGRHQKLLAGACALLTVLSAAAGGGVVAAVVGLPQRWQQHASPDFTEYSNGRATIFAKLAGAAYCSSAALEAWDCGEKCIPGVEKPVHVCFGRTTRAFVALFEGQGLVAFEGTHSVGAFMEDLRFHKARTSWEDCQGCKVHSGFLKEWRSLGDCVEAALEEVGSGRGSSVRLTGHSLGSALGSLAMVALTADGWHISEVYAFGMPRVGDANFSKTFMSLVGNDTSFFRVTFHRDPVPHVPPENLGFVHVGTEIFYDVNFTSHVECAVPEDRHCAGQYRDLMVNLLHVENHLDYMGVLNGTAGCNESAATADLVDPGTSTGGDEGAADGGSGSALVHL